MSYHSKIEWTDATWNPVTGCTKVSAGCKHCYAERLAPRVFAGQKIGDLASGAERPRTFTDVLCHPERLDQPLRWQKPRRIFVNSMSDLFHEDVPDEFILRVFDVMRQSENGHAVALKRLMQSHTFQILTKRPLRMLDFCRRLRFDERLYLADDNRPNPMRWLKHVWLGVSVEDRPTWMERSALLRATPAAIRFVSYEPALGDLGTIDLSEHTGCANCGDGSFPAGHCCDEPLIIKTPGIDWLIAGGESGPHARPSHPNWFRSVREQCAAAGVAFFMKQITKRGRKIALDGREHSEYPA